MVVNLGAEIKGRKQGTMKGLIGSYDKSRDSSHTKLIKWTGYTWWIFCHFRQGRQLLQLPVCLNSTSSFFWKRGLLYRVDPYLEGVKNNFDRVASLKVYPFPLSQPHREKRFLVPYLHIKGLNQSSIPHAVFIDSVNQQRRSWLDSATWTSWLFPPPRPTTSSSPRFLLFNCISLWNRGSWLPNKWSISPHGCIWTLRII